MHGTGTPLGDPIEVAAASAALRPQSTASSVQPLSLVASKSSAGHCEPAAGMVGLAAAAASLQHLKAVPVLHLRALNPHVESALESRRTAGAGANSRVSGVAAACTWRSTSMLSITQKLRPCVEITRS